MNQKLTVDTLWKPLTNDFPAEPSAEDLYYNLRRTRADLQFLIEDEKSLLPPLGLEYVQAIEQYDQLKLQKKQLKLTLKQLREMHNNALAISQWYDELYQDSLKNHPRPSERGLDAAVRYQLKAVDRSDRIVQDLFQKVRSLETKVSDLKIDLKIASSRVSDLNQLIADDSHKSRILSLLQQVANLNRDIALQSLPD